jgi:excisionase family DNA binding protein
MEQTTGGYVSVQQVADEFGVSTRAVWLWVRSGRVRAIQPGGRQGKYRIPVEEIARLKAEAAAAPPEAPTARSA